MENRESNQNNGRVFPENTADIIDSLLEKYKLETIKGLFESFGPVKTPEEKEEFQKRWKNLPGPHIAQTLKEFSRGKIKNEDALVKALAERLSISKKTAQELTKDLQEKILSLPQVTLEEEKEIPNKKPTPPKKPDTYREPVE